MGATEAQVRADVTHLAGTLGPRHLGRHRVLTQAADFIEQRLPQAGCAVTRHRYHVRHQPCDNLEVEFRGRDRPNDIIVIGAHYDTVPESPGANDNASGIAALLAIAEALACLKPARTLRLVAFVNEEAPCGWTQRMGSKVYVDACRAAGERIQGMFALDGLGCYRDEPGSQRYPYRLGIVYPNRGDFLAFVSNLASAGWLMRGVRAFNQSCDVPWRMAALPGWIPAIGRSDHWSFWRHRIRAGLITDTLPFRDRNYHKAGDTPDQLDYSRLVRVIQGLAAMAEQLSGTSRGPRGGERTRQT